MILYNKKKVDKYWMKFAFKFAKANNINKEVPVGAVLIYKKKIIGYGSNLSINNNDPTAHAEIIALRKGAKYIKNYRLLHSTLYVTLEPCIMCIGAIINSRIKRLVFSINSNFYSNFCKYCQSFQIKKKIFQNIKIKKIKFGNNFNLILKKFFKKKR